MGGVNFITTILCMRAPGMTMWRMPVFTWTTLITSLLIIMIFPPLAAALFALGMDRRLGGHIFDPENGGAILWQHLFWFFGHPEVYVLALPFFGIVSEIIPVFSRKPIFGYKGLVFATIAIAALSVTVWAHHMYVTGAVALGFFSFMTMMIAVPTGVKFFNWIGTMWQGSLTFETPILWVLGFLFTFLFGGLTGIILATPPLDFHVSDTYFVVAHFHYVIFGTIVFGMFAGFYFWWPKFTGKMLNERIGKIHFWLLFVGFHMTFLIQHWLGVDGMPRRYADYMPEDGFTWMNQFSTWGAILLGISMIPFFWNVYTTARNAKKVEVDDPWGFGGSLEWATSCPPRGTTSPPCPVSAPSALLWTCTTRNWRRSPASSSKQNSRWSADLEGTVDENHYQNLHSSGCLLRSRGNGLRLPHRFPGTGGLPRVAGRGSHELHARGVPLARGSFHRCHAPGGP